MRKKSFIARCIIITTLIISLMASGIIIWHLKVENVRINTELSQANDENQQILALEKELEETKFSLENAIDRLDENKHPIEIEYEEAMRNWSGNTWESVDIGTTYGDKFKDEMNKYLELLADGLADEKKKWVMESQNSWEIFVKDNEELEWQVIDQIHHGGSIMKTFSAGIYYERYRNRTLFLKRLCDSINRDGGFLSGAGGV